MQAFFSSTADSIFKVLWEPVQKKDFGSRSRRDRVLNRRHTNLYVEDLKLGTNKDIGPKNIFEMASS